MPHSVKPTRLLLLPFLLAALCAQAPVAVPPQTVPDLPAAAAKAMAGIEAEGLLRHAQYLASDALAGRLTGTPGERAAADYIQQQFERAGLEPLGDEVPGGRSFRQAWPIRRVAVDAAKTTLQFGSTTATGSFAVLTDDVLSIEQQASLRFCGFGRSSGPEAELGPDDRLDDSIPVVLLQSPRGRVGRQLSMDQKFAMSFQSLLALGGARRTLSARGAKLLLVAMLDDPLGLCDVLSYVAPSPGRALTAAGFPGAMPGMGTLTAMLQGEGAAVVVLTPELSSQLLAELDLDRDALAKYARSRARADLPVAKGGVEAKVALHVTVEPDAESANVVGVLRGSDPQLASEAVVFSSHLDHMGVRLDGAIYHGADDNASGSAGVIELAAAFGRCAERPKRTLIFLAVSGEELGLWGSRYFVSHPTWPLDQIVADVNTDMIGRNGPEAGEGVILMTPSREHLQFSTLVRDTAGIAERLSLQVKDGDKYYERSDHFNFLGQGIPALCFINGEHEDYHQVTDTADKLDGGKMRKVTCAAFWTGWVTANADERPRILGRQPEWK